MKKISVIIPCLLLVLCLSACGGKVSDAKTHTVESEMYSRQDIAAAIDVIKKEFKSNWKGCSLTEIYYAGDDKLAAYQDRTERNNADEVEVIVLLSSFDVDSSGGDGSLNPNSTYDNWMWILVRSSGGQWRHVDHGY